MKKVITLIFSTLSFFVAISQNVTATYNSLDTISIYYPALTFDTLNDGANRYYVGQKRVDKKTSDAYQIAGNQISSCRPCVLKAFDQNGIISSGVQSGDGRVGFWNEYYPKSGKIKLRGHFKECPNLMCTANCCSTKDGKWTYYNESGEIIKIETYKNNKLILRK